MDECDLLARLRGAADLVRAVRRQDRAKAALPDRPRPVRGGVDARRPRPERVATARRPLLPGSRGRSDPARHAVDGQCHVPRQGAGDRVRCLGLGDRRDGRTRPADRRLGDDGPELAVGVLHQPPDRTRRLRRRMAVRAREPRRLGRQGVRHPGHPDAVVRPRVARVRPHRGAELRLGASQADARPGPVGVAFRFRLAGARRARSPRGCCCSRSSRSSIAEHARGARCSSTSRSSRSRAFATATSRSRSSAWASSA